MTDEQILARAYIPIAERCSQECEKNSYEQMQYKAVKKACERFTPRKPKPLAQLRLCPNCHNVLEREDYCPVCGQAIDWRTK